MPRRGAKGYYLPFFFAAFLGAFLAAFFLATLNPPEKTGTTP